MGQRHACCSEGVHTCACICCHACCCNSCCAPLKFRPDDDILAFMWLGVGQPDFTFPELQGGEHGIKSLQAKPSFAICISGGGFRATTCALGWVRGLWALGAVQQAQYLCSNSGGTWFNAAFSYQEQASVEDFLGEYIEPENMTREEAKAHDGDNSYGSAVMHANQMMAMLVDGVCCQCCQCGERDLLLKPWPQAVGSAFLAPFDLGDANACFALAGEASVRAEEAGAANLYTACRDPEMPYPIFVATMKLKDDPLIFQSYEFTPQYSGMPAAIQDTPQLAVGGVLVESFAACSFPPATMEPAKSANSCQEVELAANWVPCLAEVVGISSGYLAENYSKNDRSQKRTDDDPRFTWMSYWNGAGDGANIEFADGGGTDNMAVLPAVRRGVRKIMVCGAVGTPPDDDWAGYNYDISGLFGATPDGKGPSVRAGNIDATDWNAHIQVFESRAWDDMLSQLLEQQSNGRPLFARVRSRVLRNDFQGVQGGFDIDMLWLFNGGAEAWCEQLPEDTSAMLNKAYKQFPYISVNLLDYPPLLVNCMSNLANWCVLELEQEIQSFVQDS